MKARLPDILRRLVRRFGLLVLLTVLGGIAGQAYSATKTPIYQAKSYVVVTAEAGEPFAAVNFAQAYGRVATRGPAAERAAAIIGSTRDLANVTASTSPDAPVIEITATGTDAGRVQVVANAVAQGLIDFGTARKAETRVGVSMLAQATKPSSPSSPKPPLEMAVGAAAGLLLAGLAALAGVGRTAVARRRDPDEGGVDDPTPVSPAGGPGAASAPHQARRPHAAIGAAPVRNSALVNPPALVNPSPTLSALTGAVLAPPAVVPAQRTAASDGPPAADQLAWYEQAFAVEEILEGQIEEPGATESTTAVPRIVGRAVVIYREES